MKIDSHIVLVGFMGSGKTTVGTLIAEQIGIPFIDMDIFLEEKFDMTIAEMFAQWGEARFRKAENEALCEILSSRSFSVVSTGGGAPCFFDAMDLINQGSQSFYLQVGRKELFSRLRNDDKRPLLKNKSAKELYTFINNLLHQRSSVYAKAQHTVRGSRPQEAVARRIINLLEK